MTSIRILHIEDEPDIREVVEISLSLDPAFETRSCGSGIEGMAVALAWLPDLILLDVMMPGMDGPATLGELRAKAETADIPVVFMTGRAQTRELDRFRSLGAAGVIAKPFDPMTLAASVRNYVPATDNLPENLRSGFRLRVKRDFAALTKHRDELKNGTDPGGTLAKIKHLAHGLAGAGGIFGFAHISDAASLLEEAVMAKMAFRSFKGDLDAAFDNLIPPGKNNLGPDDLDIVPSMWTRYAN